MPGHLMLINPCGTRKKNPGAEWHLREAERLLLKGIKAKSAEQHDKARAYQLRAREHMASAAVMGPAKPAGQVLLNPGHHVEVLKASKYYGRHAGGWVVLVDGHIALHGDLIDCQRFAEKYRWKQNPGAKWHMEHADEAKTLAESSKLERNKHYFQGKEAAHLESWGSSINRPARNPSSLPTATAMGPQTRSGLFQALDWLFAQGGLGRSLGQAKRRQLVDAVARTYKVGRKVASAAVAEWHGSRRGRWQTPIRKNPVGFSGFHGASPDKAYKVKVPQGWPRRLWMLGTLHLLRCSDGGSLRGGFVASGSGDRIYILQARGNARDGSRVAQIEYIPPRVSQKAGATYYHPFDRPPVLRKCEGGCYTVAGQGLKLTPRGIVG